MPNRALVKFAHMSKKVRFSFALAGFSSRHAPFTALGGTAAMALQRRNFS